MAYISSNCDIELLQRPRTLFLGLSVYDFTMDQGIGNQSGRLTVRLVEDCRAGIEKTYYDYLLRPRTWTGPDPGFFASRGYTASQWTSWGGNENVQTPYTSNLSVASVDMIFPTNGIPVYFRYGDFEFAGILQNFERSLGDDGSDVYTANIVSPDLILEGIKIITGEYAGSVREVHNLINAYAFLEDHAPGKSVATDSNCAFPTPCIVESFPTTFASLYFGGARVQEDGMPWSMIQQTIHATCNRLYPDGGDTTPNGLYFNKYCYWGRVQDLGDSINNNTYARVGMGYLPVETRQISYSSYGVYEGAISPYLLDLAEIPTFVNNTNVAFRTGAGGIASLSQILDDITTQMSLDYYTELLPTVYNGDVFNIIKVRSISKRQRPTGANTNSILSFVSQNTNKLVNYSYGGESRNENVNAFILGGQRKYMKPVVYNALESPYPSIWPFWGVNESTGDLIIGVGTGDSHQFSIDVSDLNIFLPTLGGFLTTFTVSVRQMRAALAGQDIWEDTVYYENLASNSDILTDIEFSEFLSIDAFKINRLINNDFIHRGAFRGFKKAKIDSYTTETEKQFLSNLFNKVRDLANEYYGRKFLVRIPYVCPKNVNGYDQFFESIGDTTSQVDFNWQPTQAGWPVQPTGFETATSPFLDLDSTGVFLFRDAKGLLNCFIELDTTKTSVLDFGQLNKEDMYVQRDLSGNPSRVFMKVQVDQNVYFANTDNYCGAHAVITLPAPLPIDEDLPANTRTLANLIYTFNTANSIHPTYEVDDIANLLNALPPGDDFGNIGEYGPAYMIPDGVSMPIQDNVRRYGPWTPFDVVVNCDNYGFTALQRNLPPGSVDYVINDEYVPWNFPSDSVLDCLVVNEARAKITYIREDEVGSVTLLGAPDKPLGAEVFAPRHALGFEQTGTNRTLETITYAIGALQFPYMVVPIRDKNGNSIYVQNDDWAGNALVDLFGWTGYYGPNITNMTFTLSPDGKASTQYQFRTYTEKRGAIAKYNINRIQRFRQAQLTAQSNLRQLYKGGVLPEASVIGSYLSPVELPVFALLRDPPNVADQPTVKNTNQTKPGKTSQAVSAFIVPTPDGITNASVSAGDHEDLIRSVSIASSGNNVEGLGYESFDGLYRPFCYGIEDQSTSTILPNYEYNPSASGDFTAWKMSPFLVPNDFIHPSSISPLSTSGHSVEFIARSDSLDGSTIHPSGFKLANGDGTFDYSGTAYMPMAIAGPPLIASYGVDTDGNYLPGDSGGFDPNYLRDYSNWKVGPLDIRWRDDTATWVAGGSHNKVLACLDNPLSPTFNSTTTATVFDNNNPYGRGDGTEQIEILGVFCQPLASGTIVLAEKIDGRNQYIVLKSAYQQLVLTSDVDCGQDEDGLPQLAKCYRGVYTDSAFTYEECELDSNPGLIESGNASITEMIDYSDRNCDC